MGALLKNRGQQGITLIEMAIVMVIAGLLLGSGILLGQSLLHGIYAKELLALAQDISTSSRHFKERYHYLPGDLPMAANDIAGITAENCNFPVVGDSLLPGAKVGNGLINNIDLGAPFSSESLCVRDHLASAGLIKGGVGEGAVPVGGRSHINSRYGPVVIIANSGSGLVANHSKVALPANTLNVIEFANLPRDIAMQLDLALDDGNLTTGSARADADPGVDSQSDIKFFAVPL